MKKIICLICAREGSKGLKNKNIKRLHNKFLIEWTFEIAKSIKEFHKVILSTDSKKIIKIAKKNEVEVPFIRPKNLAKDNSKEINVWKHALKYLKKIKEFPDILVVLHATSPLRKKKHITDAIKKFKKDKSDALISIKEAENNPYFNMVELNEKKYAKIVNDKKRFTRRQDAPKVYSMSTICFVLKPNFVLKNKNIFDGKVTTALFDKKYSVDIDDKYDFEIAKHLFNKKK
jgi:CMP-N-acetylneuraminic acid synthetase